MFHWRDNLWFERLEYGSVRIIKLTNVPRSDRKSKGEPQYRKEDIIFECEISPLGWASIIASVSAYGEADDGWRRAVQFHDETKPTDNRGD